MRGTVSAPRPLTLAALTKLRRERDMCAPKSRSMMRLDYALMIGRCPRRGALIIIAMDTLELLVAAALALVSVGALFQLLEGWLEIPHLADLPTDIGQPPKVSVVV